MSLEKVIIFSHVDALKRKLIPVAFIAASFKTYVT